MIGNRRVLGLITARGGSKGLPGKNVMMAGGRPLLAWTIDAAHASRTIDRLILSTDDDAIAATAKRHGCDVPFIRPAALATDTATSLDVVLHALEAVPGFDVVVLLQPTSPLRTAGDIDAVVQLLESAPSSVTVCSTQESPYWMYHVDPVGHLRPLLPRPSGVSRRQDLPPTYVLNGAAYAADVAWLMRSRAFVTDETIASLMPIERSLDIDTADDFDALLRAIQKDPRVAEIPRPSHH